MYVEVGHYRVVSTVSHNPFQLIPEQTPVSVVIQRPIETPHEGIDEEPLFRCSEEPSREWKGGRRARTQPGELNPGRPPVLIPKRNDPAIGAGGILCLRKGGRVSDQKSFLSDPHSPRAVVPDHVHHGIPGKFDPTVHKVFHVQRLPIPIPQPAALSQGLQKPPVFCLHHGPPKQVLHLYEISTGRFSLRFCTNRLRDSRADLAGISFPPRRTGAFGLRLQPKHFKCYEALEFGLTALCKYTCYMIFRGTETCMYSLRAPCMYVKSHVRV